MKVVKLSVHRNKVAKRERAHCRDQLVKQVRLAPKDIDGFALVWFRRGGADGTDVETNASYSCRDAMDTFHLPDMARGALLMRLVEPETDG